MNLKIDKAALDLMHEHAKDTFPYECVGFFYGNDKGEVRNITLAREVTNSKEGDQRRRFEVSPMDYMKAERFAAENNTTLLGIYHSHPKHPAIPSEHDLKFAQPFFSYIIVSVDGDGVADTRSWVLDDSNKFLEEIIEG